MSSNKRAAKKRARPQGSREDIHPLLKSFRHSESHHFRTGTSALERVKEALLNHSFPHTLAELVLSYAENSWLCRIRTTKRIRDDWSMEIQFFNGQLTDHTFRFPLPPFSTALTFWSQLIWLRDRLWRVSAVRQAKLTDAQCILTLHLYDHAKAQWNWTSWEVIRPDSPFRFAFDADRLVFLYPDLMQLVIFDVQTNRKGGQSQYSITISTPDLDVTHLHSFFSSRHASFCPRGCLLYLQNLFIVGAVVCTPFGNPPVILLQISCSTWKTIRQYQLKPEHELELINPHPYFATRNLVYIPCNTDQAFANSGNMAYLLMTVLDCPFKNFCLWRFCLPLPNSIQPAVGLPELLVKPSLLPHAYWDDSDNSSLALFSFDCEVWSHFQTDQERRLSHIFGPLTNRTAKNEHSTFWSLINDEPFFVLPDRAVMLIKE